MGDTNNVGAQLGMMAAQTGAGLLMGIGAGKRQVRQTRKLQEIQIAGQKEMTDYNAAKQLQMWHDTGYGAQVEQMAKAGLNPGLIYGMSGGGGQTAQITGGNVSGQAAAADGNMGMGITAAAGMRAQLELLNAQKENIEADTENKKTDSANNPLRGANIEADTANKGLQGKVLETTNELQKLDKTVAENTLWERVNEIVSRSIEQQERGIQAGVQTEISQATVQDNINRIKEEAINAGLQGASMKAGIGLTEEQTRKVGADIIQRWKELNLTEAKNMWEHHDRLKGIETYTETALKVAGIQAVGNVVRDVVGIATRRVPGQKKSETTTTIDPKGGEKVTHREFNY